jgi:hypothetical protein
MNTDYFNVPLIACALTSKLFVPKASTGRPPYAQIAEARITLVSLFGREFVAVEIIEFFGTCHKG